MGFWHLCDCREAFREFMVAGFEYVRLEEGLRPAITSYLPSAELRRWLATETEPMMALTLEGLEVGYRFNAETDYARVSLWRSGDRLPPGALLAMLNSAERVGSVVVGFATPFGGGAARESMLRLRGTCGECFVLVVRYAWS